MESKKVIKFDYKPTRDLVGVAIQLAVWLVGFILVRTILWNMDLVGKSSLSLFSRIYLAIAFVCIVVTLANIYSCTFNRITFNGKELTYTTGLFSVTTIYIPVKRIQTCTKSIGFIQRLCGTMDISITVTGERDEIVFNNIGKGEDAYKLITELISANP